MNVKRLRKAYQRATVQSVQIDGEIKSMREDQGLKNLTEATIKAETAEQLFEEARKRLAQRQAATGRRWSLVLFALSALFVLLAKAQTTGTVCTVYTIPSGINCNHNPEGCYYEGLTSTQPNGTILYGRFEAGGNTQLQYEQYLNQNPGYKGQFCGLTSVWTVTYADPNHGEWVMDCNATAEQTSADGPVQIHADIHSHKVTEGLCNNHGCWTQFQWIVDQGSTITITPIASASVTLGVAGRHQIKML